MCVSRWWGWWRRVDGSGVLYQCRCRGDDGMERWVGLGVISDGGKRPVDCEPAAKSPTVPIAPLRLRVFSSGDHDCPLSSLCRTGASLRKQPGNVRRLTLGTNFAVS
jgi:hypothetical protein